MPFAIPVIRNLILVGQPSQINTNDLLVIRDCMKKVAPDVRVLLVGREDDARLITPEFWRERTLTVSFGPLGRFQPLRGPVLANRSIAKLDQYDMLRKAGVRTPLTAPFEPGSSFDPREWGALVIVKPAQLSRTSSGEGLALFRTERINAIASGEQPTPQGLQGQMLVQSFVDTGPRFSVYRCLTLFGSQIYQSVAEAEHAHPPLAVSDDATIESIHPEPPRGSTGVRLSKASEIANFACQMAAAFPDVPILGCDILREHGSGELFAIEVNAGGNVWHLSSPRAAPWRRIDSTVRYLREFNSFETAAYALARTVRAQAT